ncbi:MAG: T9SS type A sorting domain-containing protein [Putridiphycobacter sp.]
MKKILTILSILIISQVHSQNINFIKSYGNNGYDYGRDIKQDLDTGYIATGSSSSFMHNNADAFLLKVDSLGNFKWSYSYGGNGADWGESVVITLDSSYAIGGYTNSFGAGGFDFYLIRADKNGAPLWEKTYGGSDWDRAHSLVQLPDSGFVIVGETYSFGNGNMDAFIIRTDKLGDTLWTNTYGGFEDDYANGVLLDGDSIIVVGGTKSFGQGMTDGLILKYHIDGTLGWSKYVGKDKEDYFTSIAFKNSDYVIGGTRDYHHKNSCDCGQDFWTYFISNDGLTVLSDTSFSGEQLGTEIAYDVVSDGNDNTVVFGGSTTSWGSYDIAQGYSDAYIGKINNSYGFATYISNFGTEKSDIVFGMDSCYDGGIIAVGDLFFNSTGGYNMFIAKIDKNNTPGVFHVTQDLTNEIITLSFEDIHEQTNLNVYPTPFKSSINFEGLPNYNVIKVFDYSGKLVYSGINQSQSIDLSNLTNGLYILTIETEAGQFSTKIVKN